MCSSLKGFLLIVPLKATKDEWRFWFWLRGDWLHGMNFGPLTQVSSVMDTVEFFEKFGTWVLSRMHIAHRGDWLSGVIHTTESDSSVWCTPWSLTLQWDAHRGVWLIGMMPTAKSNFAVGCPLQSLTLQWHAHLGVWLIGMMHTAESNSSIWFTLRSL